MKGKSEKKSKIISVLFIVIFLSLILLAAKLFVENENNHLVDGYKSLLGVSVADSKFSRKSFLINQINENSEKDQDFNFLVREAQSDPQQQVENIDELMAFGIVLLIISPIKDDLVYQKLLEIKDKIPLIILDERAYIELGTAFVEYDNYDAGKILAKEIINNPKINDGLLIITGPESDYVSEQRKNGLLENLPEDIQKNTMFLESNWIRNDAENKMKYYIVSNLTTRLVVGLNDQMAFGAQVGANKLRAEGMDYYGINGFKGQQEGKHLVGAGILKGTVSFEENYTKIIELSEAIINHQTYEFENILKATFIK